MSVDVKQASALQRGVAGRQAVMGGEKCREQGAGKSVESKRQGT